MEWVEGIDPDEPGVRRVPWSSVGENPPEVRAHIARKEAIRERKANRREVHPQRKPPLEDEAYWSNPLSGTRSRSMPHFSAESRCRSIGCASSEQVSSSTFLRQPFTMAVGCWVTVSI